MDRHAVALVLDEIATLLDATAGNRFKARAFRTAARALEKADEEPHALIAGARLRELSGIGPATARVIEELVLTGAAAYHTELRSRAPSGMRALLRVPGLGPTKIAALHAQLGVSDLDSLEEAARAGRIAGVRGFGERTQQRILDGIAFARGLAGRRRLHQAEEVAVRLAGFLEAVPGIERVHVAGALRRGHEIVDGVVLVAAVRTSRAHVAARIRATSGLAWYDGDDRSVSGRFGDGMSVEIRLTDAQHLGVLLLHATGSTAHLDGLRTIARERGIELTDDALLRAGTALDTRDEESIYDALGLQFVPPELREGGEELVLARARALPQLVDLHDLRGCFHCHTTWSDGTASVADMAEGALALGWRYLGIADHSQNAGYAGGLSPAQIARQQREIAQWNRRRGSELRLFSGVEADILGDGRLDYSDHSGVLESFDYVIGSVHSLFRMARPDMTRRMRRAVSDPRLTMLGHARGRLLLIREGYDVDIDAVIDAAADAGAIIEINADPHRLDMSWQHWPRARARGVRTSINPDAHSIRGLQTVRYGVVMARKAWLTPADVLNAWDLGDVEEYLAERKRKVEEAH